MKLASLLFTIAAPMAWGSISINEIRIDQPGSDNDEFIELYSTDPGADSLANVQLVVIGDGTGASGVIESITDFSAVASPFGSDPYFLVAESTFSLGTADFTIDLGFENGDNVTFLLVSDFTGALADDLDTDDDGTLDSKPWSNLIDGVGLQENVDGVPVDANQEWGYGSDADINASVGPDGIFVPGHVFRAEDTGAWQIGDFADLTLDTPGAANPSATVVPEPSTAGLLLVSIFGMTFRRRRK